MSDDRREEMKEEAERLGMDPETLLDERDGAGEKPPAEEPLDEREGA